MHAVEREVVRHRLRSVHLLLPRPAENAPRSADATVEERPDRVTLPCVGALVNVEDAFAIAVMNRARPLHEHREVQAVECDVAELTVLDVPAPSAFTVAGRRHRVEVAGTSPIAIARD